MREKCRALGESVRPAAASGVSIRELMPETAALVDWLRGLLGRGAADALLRASQAGTATLATGRLYVAETGPDGVRREYGQAAEPGRGR